MQHIIQRLQEIIKTHYGYSSEFELKPVSSYQSLRRELFSAVDRCLSIPLHEPKTHKPIAFFKIHGVSGENHTEIERLTDLVNITLQTSMDMLDRLDASQSLMSHLQADMQPHKIISLQKKLSERHEDRRPIPVHARIPQSNDITFKNRELLIHSKSLLTLDRLALAIHDTSKNHFFIRLDHMPSTFLNTINDLTGLSQTTLYIPRIQKLTAVQQKTLETYFLLTEHRDPQVIIVCGTRSPLRTMLHEENISSALLQHLHFFHVLSQSHEDQPIKFETLSHCALSILGASVEDPSTGVLGNLQNTKSYSVIPSLNDLYPTIH